MININFSYAVAFYLFSFLGLIMIFWVFTRKDKGRDLFLDPKFIWFCSVCTYTYINTKESRLTVCPRCGSYNKRDHNLASDKRS